MTAAPSQEVTFGYLFVALFALLVLRRSYRMMHGTPYRVGLLVVLPIFYLVIYAAELSVLAAVGVTTRLATEAYASLAVDIALVIVGTFFAYRYVRKDVVLYRPEGSSVLYYRLSPLLPIVYVVLFVVRTVIAAVLLGESPFAFPMPASIESLPPILLLTLSAVDALWGLSTGFLIGRSLGVYRAGQQQGAAVPAPLA
jgi:hypothetical protein